MTEALRVLLIDDHALVRRGIRLFLETFSDIEIVGEAASGEEGVALVEEFVPDVVLLDILLPGIGGVEAARRIKRVSPHTAIVALSSSAEHAHIVLMMTAGASTYLLKDVGPAEMAAAIRGAAAGDVALEPRVATALVQALRQPPAPRPEPASELTAREREVLRLIADGLSNAQIAERLFLSEKTVKTHVHNILSKLQLDDRTRAAVYAWKAGLVSRE